MTPRPSPLPRPPPAIDTRSWQKTQAISYVISRLRVEGAQTGRNDSTDASTDSRNTHSDMRVPGLETAYAADAVSFPGTKLFSTLRRAAHLSSRLRRKAVRVPPAITRISAIAPITATVAPVPARDEPAFSLAPCFGFIIDDLPRSFPAWLA